MSTMTSQTTQQETPGELVLRAQAGEQQAWDELVERFSSLVWWTARQRGLSNDDAADVCQTTWLRCFQSIGKIRDPEVIGSWLVTTARREAIRLSKRSGRQVLVGQENEDKFDVIDVRDHVDPSSLLVNEEQAEGVRKAMNRLPEQGQNLLTMLMEHDRPNYVTIAETLDMPIGSIGPTRARHIERLRRTPEVLALAAHR